MVAAGPAAVEEAAAFTAARLERVFDACFAGHWNTRLSGGAQEPLYQPAQRAGDYHALHYRCDYFASALHEVAHWCIAGERRRQLQDFGYWYAPEGRSADQQYAFETVECKPQALEWFFSRACAYRFQVSADNLDLASRGLLDTSLFKRRVLEQALSWQQTGLPARAELFYRGLCCEFGTGVRAPDLHFTLSELVV
jgi:elongation factor P hydroxylase